MSDEEICEALGWPRRAAALLADYPDGLLGRICAVVREAERREREACAKAYEAEADTWEAWPQAGAARRKGVAAIRARGNK